MRVDFYVVNGQQERDREIFACRLAEKAYKQGLQILLRTSDEAQTYAIDNLLWSYSQGSFVPHSADRNDKDSPVRVWHEQCAEDQADLLINLNTRGPIDPAAYARIAEVINEDPERRAMARERYKTYRDQGFEVSSHNVGR